MMNSGKEVTYRKGTVVNCMACGNHWELRQDRKPKACPSCKSTRWWRESYGVGRKPDYIKLLNQFDGRDIAATKQWLGIGVWPDDPETRYRRVQEFLVFQKESGK